MTRGSHWNRAGRRSGGPRPAEIVIPSAKSILVKLARMMVDEFNAKQDYRLTREHIRNIARTNGVGRANLVDVFLAGLGSSQVDAEITRKIAELFADDVLRAEGGGR